MMDEAIEFIRQAARNAGCECAIEIEFSPRGDVCGSCGSIRPHLRLRHDESCPYLKRQRRIAAAGLN